MGKDLFGREQLLESLGPGHACTALELGVVHVEIQAGQALDCLDVGRQFAFRDSPFPNQDSPFPKLMLQAPDRIDRHEMKQKI